MAAPIVFFDIAGPHTAPLAQFYSSIFGWAVGAAGELSVPVAGPMLAGALRADPPEKGLYLGVDDVTATLDQITAAGGTVIAPRFEVPGVVVLGLFADPAGNRLGLVELGADGKPKIP